LTIQTKRWNDPADRDGGTRILVTRYRPRGVRKADETWHQWMPDLGPSRELHADLYGKHAPPIEWAEYAQRYLAEMKAQTDAVRLLAQRAAAGETITLLCSSACTDPTRCHRTLLLEILERRMRLQRHEVGGRRR
jgi:uncharacterized protein YeaO (DUF488 family)